MSEPCKRPALWGAAVGAVVLAVMVVTVAPRWFERVDDAFTEEVTGTTAADLEFDIPPGTSARIQAGEQVSLLPSPLVVTVGDTIRIRNRDRDPLLIGPFWVGARSTLTERFVEPGRFVGDCVVHPSGRLVVEVRP